MTVEMMEFSPREVIVLGGAGMLGVAWRSSLRDDPSRPIVRAIDHPEVDITDERSVANSLPAPAKGARAPLVVNCAAYTAVDQAEMEEARATLVNGRGVEIIARRCREIGATLVHYSTDYVFDGNAPRGVARPSHEPGAQATGASGYLTDYPRNPINAYGRSKAAGEAALETLSREGWNDWLCLRTSWLYAAHGKNFVLTIANSARSKPALRVVNDQRGRPTSCDNLVHITRSMLARGARGMHHGCDSGECTWFEFASAIVERVNEARAAAGEIGPGAGCRVDPCTSEEYPRPAKRPAYSVLDLSRTERLIGPVRHWRVCLSRVINSVLARTD